MKHKRFILSLSYWILSVALMLIMFYCSSFTSDDIGFTFASQNNDFNGKLNYVIMYGNGRLLGNGFSIFMIESRIAIGIIKSFTVLAITFLLSELLGVRKSIPITSLIFILILFPSAGMFSEVLNWTAGFNNYCPPIIFILSAAVLLKNIEKHTALKNILLFICGFIGQFFSENSSIFSVFLAIAVTVYGIRSKNKKLITASLIYFAATITGLILMLSFSSIVGSTLALYRSVALDIPSAVSSAVQNTTRLFRYLMYCVPVWILTSFSLIVSIIKNGSVTLFGKDIKYLLISFLTIGPINGIICSTAIDEWINPSTVLKKPIDAAIMALYLTAVIFALFKCIKDKNILKRSSFYYSAAIISYIPLTIVSPVGHRTFYLTYILIVAGTVTLLKSINFTPRISSSLKSVTVFSAIVILLNLTLVMYDMHNAEKIRNDYVYDQIDTYISNKSKENIVIENGKEIITIDFPFLPHQKLITVDGQSITDFYKPYIDRSKYELRFIKQKWEAWYTENIMLKNK